MAIAARMPMMIMTTRSSIRVKPLSFSVFADWRRRASIVVAPMSCAVGASRRDAGIRAAGDDTYGYRRPDAFLELSGALLDEIEDVENRHVQGDDHAADD